MACVIRPWCSTASWLCCRSTALRAVDLENFVRQAAQLRLFPASAQLECGIVQQLRDLRVGAHRIGKHQIRTRGEAAQAGGDGDGGAEVVESVVLGDDDAVTLMNADLQREWLREGIGRRLLDPRVG